MSKSTVRGWIVTTLICKKDKFEGIVNLFVNTINEVLDKEVPTTQPSPFMKRWWTKELTDLKKEKNRLSNLLYKYWDTPDTPVHVAHKAAINKFCERLNETKRDHWTDWLEQATAKDIYVANKYISSEPSDYSSACIPNLKAGDITTSNNTFPPPPNEPITQMAYPRSLNGVKFFTREHICKVIHQLKPYKVPGNNHIQNIILQKCMEVLIDHLYYIFCTILELDVYPSHWLSLLTIILHKPGKQAYNVLKVYQPISLLDTTGKLFSTLVAHNLSYLTEKHDLLLPN